MEHHFRSLVGSGVRDRVLMSSPPSSLIAKVVPGHTAYILLTTDPFAEADEDTGETKQSQNYIHIRIQRE